VRTAVFRDQRLTVEDWPRPAAGPGELVLRLRGCGLCGSDIAKIGGLPPNGRGTPAEPGSPSVARPLVLGHELVGDVVEIGAGVRGFAAGDRAVAAHHVPCGTCHYCRRGSGSMCRAFKASNLDPGGFADYVRVPADNVRYATFRLPASLGDEAASFVEPLACCHRAVRRTGAAPGDTCVVIGLGSIGCLFVQLFARAGATVVGVDRLPARIALASRLGATVAGSPDDVQAAVQTSTDGRGADHVVVTAGAAAVLPWAATIVRDGGSIHYFAGGPGDALPLPLETLYHRELTVTSTYSSSPADLAAAFELIVGGAIAVDALITHRLPLERLDEGVDLMRRHLALKVFVTP
jgi:L-iditol 2-dehydrogenase